TPFLLAAARGNTVILQAFIQHGADTAATDNQGRNALHHAATADHGPAIRLLRRAGVLIDAADSAGARPLHTAAAAAAVHAVTARLTAGANIRVQDASGNTPRAAVDRLLQEHVQAGEGANAAAQADLVRVRSLLDAAILEEYRAAASHGA